VKKIVIIFLTGFLISGIFSCTPQALDTHGKLSPECCGDDIPIPPPPPPPPPNGDDG